MKFFSDLKLGKTIKPDMGLEKSTSTRPFFFTYNRCYFDSFVKYISAMNVHFDSLSLVGTSLFFFSFSSSFPSTSILSSLSTSGDSTLSSESF